MIKRRIYIILLCTMTLAFFACARDRRGRTRHIQTDETELVSNEQVCNSSYSEIWSQEDFDLLAPAMPGYIPSQIIERIGYITSYNHETKCPNWVAWHLTSEHTDGPFPRKAVPFYSNDGSVEGIGNVTQETCRNGYMVDLEAEEPRQQLSDWTREYNMSHGHMCPAGDNKWDKAAMNQSFLLTNMCPQDEKLNGGGWKKLEEKCRTWANQYGSIYIVAGPIFNEPITRTLGEGKIVVPDAFFKVVLCLEGTPKVIGFLYQNDSSSQSIGDCACSVDNIEELTGLDFFYSLPDDIENIVESDSDLSKWY